MDVCSHANGKELKMGEEKTTLELYLGMVLAISHAANYKDILFNRIKRDAEEIDRF